MTRRRRFLILFLGCGTLLTTIIVLVHYSGQKNNSVRRDNPNTDKDRTKDLYRQVAILKARISQVEGQVPHRESPSEEQSVASISAKRIRGSHRRIQKRLSDLQAYNHFSRFIANEPRDDDWSAKTEIDMRRALKRADLRGITLHSVDCRTSMCKVDIGFSSLNDKKSDLRLLHLTPPFDQASFVHMTNPEALDVTVFLKRRGYPWPPLSDSYTD